MERHRIKNNEATSKLLNPHTIRDKKDINNKWNHQVKLEKSPLIEMPEYLYNNQDKYADWIAK